MRIPKVAKPLYSGVYKGGEPFIVRGVQQTPRSKKTKRKALCTDKQVEKSYGVNSNI